GFGLLLMRVVASIALFWYATHAEAPPAILPLAASVVLGALLFSGLWTPYAGVSTSLLALWNIFMLDDPWRWILLATLGLALALIGPGVWSVDARLFGWKRIEIPNRDGHGPPRR